MDFINQRLLLFSSRVISKDVADGVCKRLGRENWFRVEAEGFSGGIWILWNGTTVDLRIVHAHKQFVHLLVAPGSLKGWQFTIVYASPKPKERGDLWEELGSLRVTSPWCVAGDCNSVLISEERCLEGRSSTNFQEWVRRRGMIDLEFNGPRYTWSHGNDANQRKSARLDRALGDGDWQSLFPEATVIHCPHAYSDHCPILLRTQAKVRSTLG